MIDISLIIELSVCAFKHTNPYQNFMKPRQNSKPRVKFDQTIRSKV